MITFQDNVGKASRLALCGVVGTNSSEVLSSIEGTVQSLKEIIPTVSRNVYVVTNTTDDCLNMRHDPTLIFRQKMKACNVLVF